MNQKPRPKNPNKIPQFVATLKSGHTLYKVEDGIGTTYRVKRGAFWRIATEWEIEEGLRAAG